MNKKTRSEPTEKVRGQAGSQGWRLRRYSAYIGLDVHKDTIAVSTADGTLSSDPQYLGEIPNEPKSVRALLKRLEDTRPGSLLFCYEAGPCGYVLYRQLTGEGHDCVVVAPSLVPRRPGERIKNDRRDSRKLAEMLRAGTLTAGVGSRRASGSDA